MTNNQLKMTTGKENKTIERNKQNILYALDDCTGCIDPRSEGTHQMWSKQHFFEWYIEPYYTPRIQVQSEKEQVLREFVEWNKTFTFDPEGEGYDIQEALAGVHAYFQILDSKVEQFLAER